MKIYIFFLGVIILSFFYGVNAIAQKEMITFPIDGTVFQKDNGGNHYLYLSGKSKRPLKSFIG